MSSDESLPENPIQCVTLLYHFASDTADLKVEKGLLLSRFGSEHILTFDTVVSSHLDMHPPDYLLWCDPLLLKSVPAEEYVAALVEENSPKLIELIFASVNRLLVILGLFSPGRLRAGESFVVCRDPESIKTKWKTLANWRASQMVIDYSLLEVQKGSYRFESADAAFFNIFRSKLETFLDSITSLPSIQTALRLYAADSDQSSDVVGLVTALEALLTKREETEGLTYRLSMRTANLLGTDPTARRAMFGQIKKFYGVRSKVVHGAELDKKVIPLLDEVDALREVVRQVLLSVMSLIDSGILFSEIPDKLDDLAFVPDIERKQIQELASKFLHM